MIKIEVTSSLYGSSKKFYFEGSTEQDCVDKALEAGHLGKRNWSLPKYINDDGVEQLPDGRLIVDGNPVEVAQHKDSYSYEDEEGETIVVPERDWIEYKMPDQWTYEVEDITEELAKKEKQDRIKIRIQKAKHRKVCQDVLDAISDYNEENSLDPDALLADATLQAMFGFIQQSRGNSLYGLLSSYVDVTYYSAEFIGDLKAHIEIELGL